MTVNKAIIVGNLGSDPELRETRSGAAVCNLRIATNERRRDPEGEWGNHTEWHSVVAFGNTAEAIGKYLSKGKQVYIEGRLQTRKWTDKEGAERYKTEIVAEQVKFLNNPRDEASPSQRAPKANNQGFGYDDGIPF